MFFRSKSQSQSEHESGRSARHHLVALLFGLGPVRKTEPLELFMTSVSLAVAAVPEGCPQSSPLR
jgi:hypothetical protein